ncbi:MAG: PASTA domain-containing protein [Prevotellaceae bacterium]|jgi:cell division protein FtsI (penicillin-binding protein 3)|nr:PASTA domain-containing protein [Prevotellaceae bacterium]
MSTTRNKKHPQAPPPDRQETSSIIRRAGIVYGLVVLLGLVIITQIVILQLDSELKQEGRKRSLRQENLPAVRGNILANDGRILAMSLPYYELRLDCVVAPDSVFTTNIDGLAAALSRFFKDKTVGDYKADLIQARKVGKRYKLVNPRWVSYTELQTVKQFPIFELGQYKGGLIVEQKSKRTTPYNRLAYRTIGWKNADGVGVGIEDAFDVYLRGTPGKRMVQRLPGGEWMPISSAVDEEPRDGMHIVTTLDVDIQDAAETALREKMMENPVFEAGTAIVMEVATGEIRAIANMKRRADGNYDEAFNYAIGMPTNPGSTFKLPMLIALLEDNHVTLESTIDVGHGVWSYHGIQFVDEHRGLGTISVLQMLEHSSNVGFAKTAVKAYCNGNEKQFTDRLYSMNLHKPLGLQIKGEASPTVGYPGDKVWSGISIPMQSIGYEVLLTPLHTLTLYNAVANNGKMVKPKFVKSIQNKNGGVYKKFPTEVINSAICSPAVLKDVYMALRGVVEQGTARGINDKRYTISGKTGTSQLLFDGVYKDGKIRKPQPSFVGFFPSEAPKYSAIVVLYAEKTTEALYGSKWAAPVFKSIADKLYIANRDWPVTADTEPYTRAEMPLVKGGRKAEVENALSKLEIPSKFLTKDTPWVGVYTEKEYVWEIAKEVNRDELPSVLNMGLKDALFLLENLDLNVRFTGVGRVLKQSVAPGTKITKGQHIYLELGT